MNQLVIESYLRLIQIDLFMCFRGLQSLYDLVRTQGVRDATEDHAVTPKEICNAMDLACVFYPKTVLCLQHSAATVLLLRRYGLRAEMVIGAQLLPFRSHAWVEIAGTVVNDKPYVSEIYQQLERC